MNIRNSYISIFNPKFINPKSFLNLFLFFILFSYVASFTLNRLRLKITNNDIILDYQIQKLNDDGFDRINTIFVGDSSLGNSIDTKLFNSISKLNSKNLSLTGSFGVVGSLGIIKKALKKNPNIDNFIIIHSLNIWDKPYSKVAILELFSFKDIYLNLDIKSIFSYFLNLKEINWNIKYFFQKKLKLNNRLYKIDNKNDFILQDNNKYSNQKLLLKKGENLNNTKLSLGKLKEIEMIDQFCKYNSLNCLFLNGPIHKSYIDNSPLFLEYVDKVISKKFSYIRYFPNIFSYESFKMGDATDHIDTRYKDQSTKDIYKVIKKNLIYY
tara:strand:- start:1552 stop:2526 length:975 start_codon:yes stop_codon:yes gene_type:complete